MGNVKITTTSGTVLQFGKNTRLFNFVVDPRGWSKTDIRVKPGDRVTISASGSVNIAMGRMVKALIREYQIKSENTVSKKSRDVIHFTEGQKKESVFAYPWNGPTGIDLTTIDDTDVVNHLRDTAGNLVLKTARTGQLIAVISQSSDNFPDIKSPDSQVIPFTSKDIIIPVKTDGYLWFIVNDEKYSNDKLANKIIWQDNLGFFHLMMTIDSKEN